MTTFDTSARFLERSRFYLCDEYPAKISAALRSVPDDRLWWRAHDQMNSAGNLVLHLTGNVRQWIVSGIGGAADTRDRDGEFSASSGPDRDALIDRLLKTRDDVRTVLDRLTPAALGEMRRIQGRDTTVFAAIYHVVEHFSGHTGQVILMAKMFSPGAVRFYDDADGMARPLFLPEGTRDIE